MQTFFPYPDFQKSAQCLDNKRLGKQRVEVWQIYNTLQKGEYTKCICLQYAGGLNFTKKDSPISDCCSCKGTGKIKTPWYNHPIVQMWRGYELALLYYGNEICKEWIKRGYKDRLQLEFLTEMAIKEKEPIIYPKWLGNKEFHASHRSNLLRKDPKWYGQFGWEEPDNLPYVWIK